MLSTEHYFAVRRNKLVNSKRELCMKVLNQELHGSSSKYFIRIRLSNILHWVPDEQLEKHLRFCLRKTPKTRINRQSISKTASHLGLREIATDFEKNYSSWLDFCLPEGTNQKSPIVFKEDSYNAMLMGSIYLYEYCSNRQLFYEDAKVLQLTLNRFNFLQFFAKLKQQDHSMAVKLCERFLKLIKFYEPTTASYLLHYCKNHNIQNLEARIKMLVRVYETYYQRAAQ